MRVTAIIVSLVGLCLTVLPSFFVLHEQLSWKVHTQLLFVGMILWFISAPFWMRKEKKPETD